MRRRAKVDSNHGEVVAALRKAGWSVISMAPLGCGIPDLLVGGVVNGRRVCIPLEVKDGTKPPSARKLTPDEEAFRAAWKGPYEIVESAEQALAIVEKA